MGRFASLLALAVTAALAGCSDPLEDGDDIAGWANASSAAGVFYTASEPVLVADGQREFADVNCPTTSDNGITLTIAGDCQDSEGISWTGSVTVERNGTGTKAVTFAGYGNDATLGPVRLTGSFGVGEVEPNVYVFTANLVQKGGSETRINYQGSVVGGYSGPTTWNGSGTIERDGLGVASGTVKATTVDQVRDPACPTESWSGTTTLVSDDHTVVITYDGASACDPDKSAKWSKNGVDQGLVAGVSCAASSPSAGAAFALLALLFLRRRR